MAKKNGSASVEVLEVGGLNVEVMTEEELERLGGRVLEAQIIRELEEFPTEIVEIDSLRPHPRNYKVHPESQLEHIAQSIKEHGLYRPIVVARDGTILAGHGVVMAAKKLGLTKIAIRRLPVDWDDARALKLLAGDNEISNLGEVDDKALFEILSQIKDQDATGLMGTGYDDESLTKLLFTIEHPEGRGQEESGSEPATDGKPQYTTKIKVPTYEPQGEKPPLSILYNQEKTKKLVAAIESAAGISEEERAFLISAAQRHTVFSFNRIADYYAHSDIEVQDLFEQSALVIIDFDKAIELGYIQLTQKMTAFSDEDYAQGGPNDDDED